MKTERFSDWLRKELKTRNWSQADLARHSGISPAQITRIINDDRTAGNDSLLAIAKAFRYPPDFVLRKAGILPPPLTKEEKEQAAKDELIADIERLMEGLSEESKMDIYEYARMRRRIDEEKSNYDKGSHRKPHRADT